MAAVVLAIWLIAGTPAAEQTARLGAVFFLSGLIFGVLAVPGLAGVRGLRVPHGPPMRKGALVGSVRGVVATLSAWRTHGPALQVLAAFFLINDVLVTIQFFIVIVLSARFGLTVEGMLWLSLLFSAIAIPATLRAGLAADQRGGRPVLVGMCLALGVAIALLAAGSGDWVPIAVIVLLGFVFAPIQANFRALYASLVPPHRAAEMFGFNVIAGRLSAALGPLVFGAVAAGLGTTVALLVLLLPLGAGVVLLLKADLSQCDGHALGGPREAVPSTRRGSSAPL
jgi:UMF1 family MFS transporter